LPSDTRRGGASIGNDVTLYANAMIIGKSTIGDGVTIRAQTIVTETSCPRTNCLPEPFRVGGCRCEADFYGDPVVAARSANRLINSSAVRLGNRSSPVPARGETRSFAAWRIAVSPRRARHGTHRGSFRRADGPAVPGGQAPDRRWDGFITARNFLDDTGFKHGGGTVFDAAMEQVAIEEEHVPRGNDDSAAHSSRKLEKGRPVSRQTSRARMTRVDSGDRCRWRHGSSSAS